MKARYWSLLFLVGMSASVIALAQKYDSSGNLLTAMPGLQAAGPLPKASSTSMTMATDQGSTASLTFGLTNSAVQIKSTAGGIVRAHCANPNAAPERDFILVYNTASVTVGTTAVVDFIPVGSPTDGHAIAYGSPAQYGGSEIRVAAVKGPIASPAGASAAPTSAIDCSFWVQ